MRPQEGTHSNYASGRKEEDARSVRQEGLTGCGEVDQASMIFGCYHGLTVVTRMRCQGRKGEGKGSSRIVKSAFFSARPLFEGIRNVDLT